MSQYLSLGYRIKLYMYEYKSNKKLSQYLSLGYRIKPVGEVEE